ncbi:MAG: hypothetical protein IPI93_01090 [Sphingobacteriaceae bacterium]|nr:hypothetical protein [Sphingobacteriaceae bacterium]
MKVIHDDTLPGIEHVKDPKLTPHFLHEVVTQYLKENSPITPKIEGRSVATDEPKTLLTQLKGTTYEFR